MPTTPSQQDSTTPSAAAPAPIRRHQTVRHLLSQRQLRDSVALASPPSLRIALIAAMQSALAVLLALVMARLSPWPELVGFPGLGALAALFGRFAPMHLRMRIVVACVGMLALAVLLPSLASLAGAPQWAMLLLLALIAGASTLAVSHWVIGGPGAVIIVFAAGASMAPVHGVDVVVQRVLATLAGGIAALLVCWATDWLRKDALPKVKLPVPVAPPFRSELVAAARITVGAGMGAAIAYAAGWQHPSWAAIGTAAVMQGAHLHITMNRALQRMAGTVVGSVLVGIILSQHPSFWWIAFFIVLFQFATEVIIGYNYALGQVTVTPMALLMTYLASPATASNLPVERVMDTILGAALGIVFAVVFSSLDDRAHLHKLHKQQR